MEGRVQMWQGKEKRPVTAVGYKAVIISSAMPAALRYTMAVFAIGAVTLLGLWMRPFSYTTPFLFFYPAVFLAVWIGGFRPGLLATVLASLSANSFFLPPYNRFSLDAANLIRTAFFGVTFISICWLVDLARRNLNKDMQRQLAITQAITMTAADALFLCDSEGRTTFVNPAAKTMLGFNDEELLGRKVHDVIHNKRPDGSFYPASECPLEQVYSEGLTLYDHEDVFFNKDGLPLHVSCSVAPLIEDRRVAASVLVVRDVTQRKQAEEELIAIYENAPLVMLLVDEERRIHKSNKFAQQLSGFSDIEIFGMRGGEALRCLHALDVPSGCGFGPHCQQCTVRLTLFDTFTSGRSHQQVEVCHSFVINGKSRELTFLLSTARLEVRGQYQVLVTMQDITDRKQAEEALRESEARFRSICEHAAVGIEQLSPDGRLIMVNTALCRMLGYRETELLGKTWQDITHPDYGVHEARLLAAMLRGESNSYEIEKRYLHCNGAHVWANVTFSPVEDNAGQVLYLIAIIQDITDRKQAEKALIRSEKLAAMGRLATTIAHEVNNPLEAMTNLVYLLQASIIDTRTREYVDLFEKQLETLTRVAQQTLNFHRETGQPAEFKLSELISELLDFFGPKAKKKDLTITMRLVVEGKILGFSSEIRQVISNLLINAIEATPGDGRITIHLHEATDWRGYRQRGYRISIADTGTGIDPQHLERIFEPFFTTKGDKGTGLGLWVSMGIIDRVGGSMRVRSSRRPGGSGTCFSIFLPSEVPLPHSPDQQFYERVIPRSA
jgi:PAS domain S-box-containing protein